MTGFNVLAPFCRKASKRNDQIKRKIQKITIIIKPSFVCYSCYILEKCEILNHILNQELKIEVD